LPKDAVPVGTNDKGACKFIGRTTLNGNIILGEIQSHAGCMIFGYNSEKHTVNSYQVLRHPTEWGRQAVTRIPASEVQTQGEENSY
jgi:hypothetical protein